MADDLVVIDLNEDGVLRFRAPEEIIQWVNSEKNAWSWVLDQGPKMKGQVRETATKYNQFFNQLSDAVTHYATDKSAENLQNRIQGSFNNFIRNKLIAISRTKHGAIIQRLFEDAGGPTSDAAVRRAIAALVHMGSAEDSVGLTVPYARQATLAMLDYFRTETGTQAQVTATRDAVAAANQELAVHQTRLDNSEAEYRSKVAEWGTAIGDMLAANTQKAADIVASLEQVKATFETQMGLQAPAQYWSDKAVAHASNAKTYRGLLIGWGSAFVLITIAMYVGVFLLVVFGPIEAEHELAAGILFFGALAVWTTGALWATRIMSRIYMSEHHLAVDASERATMATTYLALTNTRSADEKDRAVVLAALFRPTADGIVKDDPPPFLTPATFLAGLATPGR